MVSEREMLVKVVAVAMCMGASSFPRVVGCRKEVNAADTARKQRQICAFRQLVHKNFQTMYSTSGRQFALYVFDK